MSQDPERLVRIQVGKLGTITQTIEEWRHHIIVLRSGRAKRMHEIADYYEGQLPQISEEE